jgi:hypothetical protein
MKQTLKRGDEVVVIAGDAKTHVKNQTNICVSPRNIPMGHLLINQCLFICQMLPGNGRKIGQRMQRRIKMLDFVRNFCWVFQI